MRTYRWILGIVLGGISGWGLASCAGASEGDETQPGGSSSTTSTSAMGGGGSSGGAGGSVGGQGAGAGGGMGGSGGAECASLGDPCSDCELAECPEEYCTCWANPQCVDLASCLMLCGSADAACVQSCWAEHPDGISNVALVQHCAATTCSASCPDYLALSACELCLFQSCESQMNACAANPSCAALLQCLAPCTTQQCQEDCLANHQGALMLGVAVMNCGNEHCTIECAVAD